MKNQRKVIREEMHKLIEKSCVLQKKDDQYHIFQKTLLKFFFNAVDITLDYETQAIFLWTTSATLTQSVSLYHLNDAVSVKISYTNLEETLKGCLESGTKQDRFYKTMLFHYNHVAESAGVEVMSA